MVLPTSAGTSLLGKTRRLLIPGFAAGLQAVAQASADAFAAASNGQTSAVAEAHADALALAISNVRMRHHSCLLLGPASQAQAVTNAWPLLP